MLSQEMMKSATVITATVFLALSVTSARSQTFRSPWGPFTNGLSARLVLTLPQRSQNVRFTTRVELTNSANAAVTFTTMPAVHLTIVDTNGVPAPLAQVDGNSLIPDAECLTIPAQTEVTVSFPRYSLVTTTFDSAVLAGRLLTPGKWTVSGVITRTERDDELGGWYGVLTIPAFEIILSKEDLDTISRIYKESMGKPEPTSGPVRK
jgi:hypothetical protein